MSVLLAFCCDSTTASTKNVSWEQMFEPISGFHRTFDRKVISKQTKKLYIAVHQKMSVVQGRSSKDVCTWLIRIRLDYEHFTILSLRLCLA